MRRPRQNLSFKIINRFSFLLTYPPLPSHEGAYPPTLDNGGHFDPGPLPSPPASTYAGLNPSHPPGDSALSQTLFLSRPAYIDNCVRPPIFHGETFFHPCTFPYFIPPFRAFIPPPPISSFGRNNPSTVRCPFPEPFLLRRRVHPPPHHALRSGFFFFTPYVLRENPQLGPNPAAYFPGGEATSVDGFTQLAPPSSFCEPVLAFLFNPKEVYPRYV